MSRAAIKWAQKLTLKTAAKHVLRVLADMADEKDQSCYPGQDYLAEVTCTSLRTVRRALHDLEEAHLVIVERRFDRYGHRTSDRYWLQLQITETPALPKRKPRQAKPEDEAVASTETETAPVDNSPTGQIDRRPICPSLPANLAIPTGQIGRSYMDESLEESPEGGAPLGPTCAQHPTGTEQPCRACGDARRLYDFRRQQPAAETPATPRPPKYDPAIYCEHLQLRAGPDCEGCEDDARSTLRNAGFLLEQRVLA